MKRAFALTGAMILALTANTLPVMAQERGDAPRGPRFDFAQVDTNGDGQITQEELDAHAAARFAEADNDGNGTLSTEELIARLQARDTDRLQRGAERMIERMDENDDGVLSAEEMAARDNSRMFERLDANDDGAISQEEMDTARERFAEMRDKGGKRHGGDHGKKGGEHGKKWQKHREN